MIFRLQWLSVTCSSPVTTHNDRVRLGLHASSHFCSGYFEDRVLLFAQVSLNRNLPILRVPQLLG
jgi:hypothetical protein